MTEHTRADPAPEDGPPSGCGVQGCLFAAVALFVILLIGLLVVAVIRFSEPPQPRFGTPEPPVSTAPAADAPSGGRSPRSAEGADHHLPAAPAEFRG